MRELELLAPARNADIGIAAIDCGADAVYIAGPRFGARQAAGNDISDIARLCSHAHMFGAKVFITLNTIIYDDEIDDVRKMMDEIREAGADAIIIQDMAIVEILKEETRKTGSTGMAMHASTQCAIRTVERAKELEALGFSRIVLEREMSLDQIREISSSVDCEIEFFVHGALCVCYSGQCYLSEKIAGRSANRGACIQACRSRYDLIDADGRTIVRDKALLSLKDYNLISRIEDLAEAGVMSFKIEGRLKNISYVRNTVRAYSMALDRLVERFPEKYRRASYGKVTGGFSPDLDKTFNRGYTELFLDGRRGKWASMDAAKSMGEELGTVTGLNAAKTAFTVKPAKGKTIRLNNGDGLSFIGRNGDVEGVRADVCEGLEVRCKSTAALFNGALMYRNYDIAFERELASKPCSRKIGAMVAVTFRRQGNGTGKAEDSGILTVSVRSEDGRFAEKEYRGIWQEFASNIGRMESMIRAQLSKTSGIYSFSVSDIVHDGGLPLLSSAVLNSIRNELPSLLDRDSDSNNVIPDNTPVILNGVKELDYKSNVANRLAQKLYSDAGFKVSEQAYELTHRDGVELMRTKYCIRHELGMCPKHPSAKNYRPGLLGKSTEKGSNTGAAPLYLMNNGQKFTVVFDCNNCEMIIR